MATRIDTIVSPERIDGRVARGARNRGRIVDAAVVLIRGGDPHPTAEHIAEEAGVGVRSVFRHFDDLDGLFRAICARVEDEVAPLADNSPIKGDLEQKVAELVARRVVVYEKVAPFRKSGRAFRDKSLAIRVGQEHLDKWHRCQLQAVLADELRGRAPELLEVVDALASFEVWDRLRSDQRLSRERASQVMRFSLLNVLTG
jgi:AcrR family transcriptional regulator